MDIFIKPKKKISVIGKKAVLLKDAADIYCQDGKNLDIGNTVVFNIPEDKKRSYVLSSIDIIRVIGDKLPNATINNIGEMDTLVEYAPKAKKPNTVWNWIKTAFVTVTLFGGSMVAIMSFHSDAQITDVFSTMYHLVFGVWTDITYVIFIPYSIGLAVGIIVFYNHFMGRKLSDDPTPIEVQMSTYEKETADSVIDNLNKEKQNECT